jgi:hypothetical protein
MIFGTRMVNFWDRNCYFLEPVFFNFWDPKKKPFLGPKRDSFWDPKVLQPS